MLKASVSAQLTVYVGFATGLLLLATLLVTYGNTHSAFEDYATASQTAMAQFADAQRQALESQNAQARSRLAAQQDATALARVQDAANQIDALIQRTSMIPRAIAARQQLVGAVQDEQMVPFIANVLALTPVSEAFGATIAYDFVPWDAPLSMPWVDRNTWPKLNVVGYDYADGKWPWFSEPKRSGRVFISEPYFDAGGSNVTMVTISQPVYTPESQLIGIATTDLALAEINQIVQQLKVSDSPVLQSREYGFLTSRAGNLIVHPNTEWMLRPNAAGDSEVQGRRLAELLEEGGDRIAAAAQGVANLQQQGIERRVYWATAPLTGWKVALNVPTPTIDLPTVTVSPWTPPDMAAVLYRLTVQVAIVGLLGLAVVLGLVLWLGRNIGQRIQRLSKAAEEISQGKLDQPIDVRGKDEISRLAQAFQRMQRSLALAMKQLRPDNN